MGLFTRSSYRCWHIRTLPANAQESMIKRVIAQHEKEAGSALVILSFTLETDFQCTYI